jgi:hypothetical protein
MATKEWAKISQPSDPAYGITSSADRGVAIVSDRIPPKANGKAVERQRRHAGSGHDEVVGRLAVVGMEFGHGQQVTAEVLRQIPADELSLR